MKYVEMELLIKLIGVPFLMYINKKSFNKGVIYALVICYYNRH